MPNAPVIDELRLTRFKSFRDAALPLGELTLLIGRNGSGKSNAIDGLQVLSKLAQGEDIRDAIEGSRREGPEVRGGVRGCVPFGEDAFVLGCTVAAGDQVFRLDVSVQVEPEVQIVEERLTVGEGSRERALLCTDPPGPDRSDIIARYDNGKQGKNPALPFRSSRLLVTQVPTKVPTASAATRRVHEGARLVVEALESVFVLDPVPALMRQYVPARDTVLRRQADNLSAAVGALLSQSLTADRLRELVQALPEQRVDGISVQSSPLGDVIIALEERLGRRNVPVSARVMSDGMLRFLAFATALLEAPLRADEDTAETGQTTLVIEEIENGLHPSQAARLVDLIREESRRRQVRTLATTHSPAILTALEAADHAGVVVCDREEDGGASRLRRLVDLPAYARAMASGTLGEAVTRRRLEEDSGEREDAPTLEALLAGDF
jgi:predicted ATPase